MQQEAKRSHHAPEVSNACPALPRRGLQEDSVCTHPMLLGCLPLCGQLRAMAPVCRNSASNAVDGLLLITVGGTACVTHASRSDVIPPLLLQQLLPPPRLLRPCPCSAVRAVASTS
jgi:hypothetical protein